MNGQNTRFDLAAAVPPADRLGAVHLIAIGGSGMSGVARLLLERGIPVSGSDAHDSETLRELSRRGARVHVGHDPTQLGAASTVIVSSAVRESNPELTAARARGLRVLHRAQGIAAVLALEPRPRTVAVAGANGKTTTSAMTTVALQEAGVDPGYVIGAPLVGSGASAGTGGGGTFVVEADESDGSFVVYRPDLAVVTNVRPDHLDFYGDVATLEAAYARFAATIRAGGALVACADDPGAVRLASRYRDDGGQVLTYGSLAGSDVRLEKISSTGGASRALLVDGPGGRSHELVVPLPGRHNLLNAAAAYAVAGPGLGLSAADVLAGLARFPGTQRRFQRLGHAGGVEVVDDYAHNPDKVAAVVQAGRAGVSEAGRLVVVFQPHLYSRTRDFADELGQGLAGADVVVVTDVYGSREDPLPGVSGALVSRAARRAGAGEVHDAVGPGGPDAVARLVATLVRPGDLVLTVGAGDVTGVGPRLLALIGDDEHDPATAPRQEGRR